MAQYQQHQAALDRATSHILLAATPAVGSALSALVSAFALITKPEWAVGQSLPLFLVPIIFAALSYLLLMRPDRDPPASFTGVESFSGHLGPIPGDTGPIDQRAKLKGQTLSLYEGQLRSAQRLQTICRRLIWLSYLVFAAAFSAIFAYGL